MAYDKPTPDTRAIAQWLESRLGAIEGLSALEGGFWSSAYAFRAGTDDLILRLSDVAESFDIDTAAMAFAGPDLPVPEVVERGEALGHQFALSRRHYGQFVELAPASAGDAVGNALAGLLRSLRAVPAPEDRGAYWYANEKVTWREALVSAVTDSPERMSSGWSETLRRRPRECAVFEAARARMDELLPFCPERQDLVHSDLLHQNVLVDSAWATVTGVFSWKCSMRGDFLYDVAWCTFWSAWHPGIAAANLWERTCAAEDLDRDALTNAAERHHCYELQVAASHFGWNVWTGDFEELTRLADETQRLLERGPRAA
tara:strand:- start:2055 stop:3002 length:948 start_codon:yes stop_codon:yes gene_type:complete